MDSKQVILNALDCRIDSLKYVMSCYNSDYTGMNEEKMFKEIEKTNEQIKESSELRYKLSILNSEGFNEYIDRLLNLEPFLTQ